MDLRIKQLEDMYPWLSFDKNALKYSWDNLVSDQLILIESSIRRNYFSCVAEVSLFLRLPYQFLKTDKYHDDGVWHALIDLLSNLDNHGLKEELTLPFIQGITKWMLENKIGKTYDLLRVFDGDRSSKIFKKDKVNKTIINSLAKDIYKITNNELKEQVTDFISDANAAKKYAPAALKIVQRSDWADIFRHVIENTDKLPGKIKIKDSELKQLSCFMNAIEKLEGTFNRMQAACHKATDMICASVADIAKNEYEKIKTKFENNYDATFMTIFCAVFLAVLQGTLEKDSFGLPFVCADSFTKFKVIEQCEFVLSSNMTSCLKKYFEADMKALETMA